MKIHITNLYNFNQNDMLVRRQHILANIGRKEGFLEMGIFEYPVHTDSRGELSKRLDGVISSVENGDIVFFQLPTKNGYDYEMFLFQKIKAYKNTKIVLLLHQMDMFMESEENEKKYLHLCESADLVVCPKKSDFYYFKNHQVEHVMECSRLRCSKEPTSDNSVVKDQVWNDSVEYQLLLESDFYYKHMFFESIKRLFVHHEERLEKSEIDEDHMIHVGFGLHDKNGNYSKWVGVTMQSIIEHTLSTICFHVLIDDSVNNDNKKKLLQVASEGGHVLKFHFVDVNRFSDVIESTKRYTVGALFRAMLPEILPYLKKIIYLDADLFVNRDISELWKTNIQDYCLAGTPDVAQGIGNAAPIVVKNGLVKADEYINSGVLYMNLEKIRLEGNLCEKVIDFIRNEPLALLPDQDAINAIFVGKVKFLDVSWNYLNCWVKQKNENKLENMIYHFAGSIVQLSSGCELDQRYVETLFRTPWGKDEGAEILKYSIVRVIDRIGLLEKILAKVSEPGVIKIFYGNEIRSMRKLYSMLHINEEDYRVLSQVPEEKGILECFPISKMIEEQRPHIIFVLPDADDWKAISTLSDLGKVEMTDYFIIPQIFGPKDGGYVDVPANLIW